jgi:UDPglucose 6-dehydrogenase
MKLNYSSDIRKWTNMKRERVSVLGIGYVGLCTAVAFASKGYNVLASTHSAEKAAKINKGIPPFHEPHLQKLLSTTIQNGNLTCLVNQTEKAVLETDLTFNAVGTPSRPDGSVDLQFIEKSTHEIGKALKQKGTYHLVIIKSTVVPGTTQDTVKPILEKESKKKCGPDFGLCMNPEFLRQGSAFEDTLHTDRIVIGEYDKKSGDTLNSLYNDFYGKNTPPTIRTTLSTAELIKYSSNSLLATKISFINMIANICEKIPGTDVKTVATAMGLDKRIGPLFLKAGLGYGGSCFPKDVKALIAHSKSLNYTPALLEEVENVNKTQPLKAVQFCKEQLGNLKGKNMAVLGLAFKPNTDDMREARVIPIINQLTKEGANVTAYDPIAIPTAKTIFKNKIQYATSAVECLKNADCCILVTEWDEFKKLKPEDFIKNMKQPVLIDGRRIYDPDEFSRKMKFAALGLGKGKIT